MNAGAQLSIRNLSKRRVGVGTALGDHGVAAAGARGMIEHALEGARGRNFVNPAPRLDESIA